MRRRTLGGLIFCLTLAGCGIDRTGLREPLGYGPGSANTQNSVYSGGGFGCQAQPDRSIAPSGGPFRVIVTVYNASGTPSIEGVQSQTDSSGRLYFVTAYTPKPGSSSLVLYNPTLTVTDGQHTASCSFKIEIQNTVQPSF